MTSVCLKIKPQLLSKDAFLPFGNVVSQECGLAESMNGQAFNRSMNLADIDIGSGKESRVQINIAECNRPEPFPYMLKMMERHPDSSQLFFPLFDHDYLVAVAPPSEVVRQRDICLFMASSNQGVNYRRGTWHMPMLGLMKGDCFLMVERNDMHLNCELIEFNGFALQIDLPNSLVA